MKVLKVMKVMKVYLLYLLYVLYLHYLTLSPIILQHGPYPSHESRGPRSLPGIPQNSPRSLAVAVSGVEAVSGGSGAGNEALRPPGNGNWEMGNGKAERIFVNGSCHH